ncbi:MAG: transporter [Frankiales bacterium]|nr:transporter [Frankiales bacterium]
MTSRRPLVGLLAAHAVSMTGNVLTLVALPLYVLMTTGSAALTGVTGFFATLPVVLGGAFGGVLVDRMGYRRASVLADLVSGATIALVPLLDATVGLPFPALLGLVFVSGLLDTPGQTARTALLPDLAADAGVPLERAVGWLEATERGARMLGAPLAGLGIALLGPLSVLALDAVTFLVSALLVARLVPVAARAAVAQQQGYWRDLAGGFRFTVREPLLRAIVLLVLVTNMLDAAKTSVLLPVFSERELGGGAAFGLLVGVMAGGALAGNLVFSAVGSRLPRRPVLVVCFTLAGGPPSLAMAAGLDLAGLVAVTALAGFAAGAINPLIGAVKLERVPSGMRARVYGLIGAGCWAAMPLGALLAGFAVEHAGLRPTLLAVGATYVLVTLSPLLGGPWRELDRPRPEPANRSAQVSTAP